MSAAPDPIAERIAEEEQERKRQQRDKWDQLFAEWLTNRAGGAAPENDIGDEEQRAHFGREAELARLITTTPAVYPWMILDKLEVLEHYLGADGGTAWSDNRELVMLAGIKADLLRFEPREDED